MPLHSILRELRKKAGLTQEKLAAKCGVPLGAVRRYEQRACKSPGLLQVFKILRCLGVEPNMLLKQLLAEDPDLKLPPRKKRKKNGNKKKNG